VTSANFSETAQRHNFEAGWLTTSTPRVQEISKQFAFAVEQGLFQPLEHAN
jgi:phosphatidylserine/phosphatidylglycerophosphate/cardiolipin synthase-like enzyme